MPATMSFLDLERLGVPSVTPDEQTKLGLWKMHAGHLVHKSSPDFAQLEADDDLAGPIDTTSNLLRHLLDLSRGTGLGTHAGSGESLLNPALQVSLQDRAWKT